MGFKHALGITVKDRVTGFEGIITARGEQLCGPPYYVVQPEGRYTDNNGFVVPEARTVDEPRIEVVEGTGPVELDLSVAPDTAQV